MKKNKIQVKTKKGCQKIIIKVLKSQQVNMREVQLLNQRAIPQLMPVEYDQKSNSLIYNTTGCYSLKERFKGIMTKQQFIDILIEIIELQKQISAHTMYIKNLVFDFDKIFYAPQQQGNQLIFVYVPIMAYDNEVILKDYLKQMPFTISFSNSEPLNYVSDYIAYFNNNINFSIYDFEMFVRNMNGEKDTNLSDNASSAESFKVNGSINRDIIQCPKCGMNNRVGNSFCQECGNVLDNSAINVYNPIPAAASQRLSMSDVYQAKSQQLLIHPEQPQIQPVQQSDNSKKIGATGGTTFLGAVTGSDATVMLTPPEPTKKAMLIRKKSGERINLGKEQFIIGKEVAKVNYAVMNNNTVSRQHLQIDFVGGDYYIKDLNSSNGTYLNNQKLIAGEQMKIIDGDIVRLSDEEFTFEYI